MVVLSFVVRVLIVLIVIFKVILVTIVVFVVHMIVLCMEMLVSEVFVICCRKVFVSGSNRPRSWSWPWTSPRPLSIRLSSEEGGRWLSLMLARVALVAWWGLGLCKG